MTWSVVATDAETGEIGVAVASCVPIDVVLAVPGLVVGRGALVTQSYLLDGERDRAVALLAEGRTPDDVLATLVDPRFDPDFELRQIAIVGLGGDVASFTGLDALGFAGHAFAQVGSLRVAVQGNLLTGPEVIEAALEAALDPTPCDLPARLVASLEAGGRDGRGDVRCTPLARSSQSATLQAGAFRIDVGVAEAGRGVEPLDELRARFDEVRAEEPCPASARPDVGSTSTSTTEGGTSEPPHDAADVGDGDGCMCSGPSAFAPGEPGVGLVLALALSCLRRRFRSAGRRTRR